MLKGLAKAAQSEEEMPTALLTRPKLTEWQQTFMDAFNTLNGSRTYTAAGPAGIPYPYILLWATEHSILDASDREEFVAIVQSIDMTYLSEVNKK
jgi:hypothetical protein